MLLLFPRDYSLKFQVATVKNRKEKSRENAEGLKIKANDLNLNPFEVQYILIVYKILSTYIAIHDGISNICSITSECFPLISRPFVFLEAVHSFSH